MPRQMDRIDTTLRRLWIASPPLTATGLVMLVVLAGAVLGMMVDPRMITGVPAWLKPAKFAVSIAIYTLTLAWVFTYLDAWPKTRRVVGLVAAVTLGLEMVIIVLQAARGTTSHFNVGTPFDAVLFAIMGLAIVVQTVTSGAVAVALWRQRFADRALGWALRFGMVMTIVGASTGGLMTTPTPRQLAEAKATGRLPVSGAHTVGAPDGGPGLPATGWSVEHGDVRVAHFLGLHSLQLIPLVLLVLPRRRMADDVRVKLVSVAAASYFALFATLLWQALRGQPVIRPDAITLAVLGVWATGTATAAWAAGSHKTLQPMNGGQ